MPKPPPDTSNPPIILWRTGYQYRDTPLIDRVLAVKVTAKTALLERETGYHSKPQRVMLHSEYEQYHLTWAEAYAFVRDRAHRRLDDAERALAQAVAHRKEVLALTPPEEGV
jgi:hypothetical protein